MKIAYFGSPIFSATLLEQLILDKSLGLEISLVVTQPDKPMGRRQVLTPSPVKEIAQKYKIEVWSISIQSEDTDIFSTRDERSGLTSMSEQARGDKNGSIELLNKLQQVDLAIVFAYGFKQLIPLDLLRAPKIQFEIGEGKTSGFINIHPSLLPRFRGSSPIAYPILLGIHKTGVTLFVMDEKMDHGPIIAQEEMEIRLNDVRSDMEIKLTNMGHKMIKEFLSVIASDSEAIPLRLPRSLSLPRNDKITLTPQHDSLATRAPFMIKDDGFVPLSVLQKGLKNEPLTLQELPHIIRDYFFRYKSHVTNFKKQTSLKSQNPKSKQFKDCEIGSWKLLGNCNLDLGASSRILYNFWRGMNPWPGLWTRIVINNEEKRLKILSLSLHKNQSLIINTVQLEGKKEVDFPTFQKAYGIFS